MGYWLLSHPNPHGDHFYRSRRGNVLAIVVHITAGLEDLDATADQSAENTARYAATTDRQVSWHSGSDSDSAFDLLPASYTAFHVQGYNSRTYGHEISKRDTDWRDEPEPWRTRTLRNAGRHLGTKARELGVPLRKATRAELDHAIATGGKPVGFIGHWELDEDRRTDPGLVRNVGDTFPWTEFFAMATNQEDDMTPAQEAKLDQVLALAKATRTEVNTLPGRTWIHQFDTDGDKKGDTPAYRALPAAIAAAVTGSGDIDEAEVARQLLALLTPEAIADAISRDVAADVADLLSQRLAG